MITGDFSNFTFDDFDGIDLVGREISRSFVAPEPKTAARLAGAALGLAGAAALGRGLRASD